MKWLVLLLVFVGVAAGDAPPHFDHGRHRERGLDVEKCATCHETDAAGTIHAPAAKGHSPCLNGACHSLPADKQGFSHAQWFVAVGPTTKAKNPQLYAKAASFCVGCHGGTEPPAPSSKPGTWAVLQAFLSEREYHVVMTSHADNSGHFTHVQSAGMQCTTCHLVGGKTDVTPGHAQCQGCHKTPGSEAVHSMAECGKCHKAGGREQAYPADSRPHVDVRQCGSERHVQMASRQHVSLDKITCFSHDKDGHRFYDKPDGTPDKSRPVECITCHKLVVDNRLDLAALHTEPVIPSKEDAGHALCGSCHHHKKDVFQGSGPKCLACHADHTRSEWQ